MEMVPATLATDDLRLKGRSIDRAVLSPEFNGRELRVTGWALGNTRRAVAVECASGSDVLARFALVQGRPDVEAVYPDVHGAGFCGFDGTVRFLNLSGATLDCSVVLDSQERVSLGSVGLARSPEGTAVPLPTVSVVITCDRQARFLDDSIGSVLRQTYPAIEIVVVDDGSPDNTEEIARRVPGVVYVRQRKQGLSVSRNSGLKVSTGEYVLFLDADARLLLGAVAAGMSCFEADPALALVAGQFVAIGPNAAVLPASPRPALGSTEGIEVAHDYVIGPLGAMLFRRSALDQIGGVEYSDPGLDYLMALRIARRFPIHVHDQLVFEDRRYVGPHACRTAIRRWRPTESGRTAATDGPENGRQTLLHGMLLADDPRLKGYSIDRCVLSPEFHGRELRVAGWALGDTHRVVAVECSAGSGVLGRFPLVLQRPDIKSAFRDVPDAGSCGFECVVRFVTVPDPGVEFAAVLESQERVPLGAAVLGRYHGSEASDEAVSVVIPCYQQGHFLDESIGSALRQNHPAIEVIVVDDGSPDNTEEVARRIPGVLHVRQRNQGLSAARNSGLRSSTGDFVVFLDADDRLAPGAVAAALSCLRTDPGYGMVAGQFRVIGLNGVVLAVPPGRASRSNHYVEMVRDYFIGPPGVMMIRRAVLDEVGGFDPSIGPAADYDMALRIARRFPIHVHDQLAMDYRRHAANMSSNPAVMLETTMKTLRRQWPFLRKRPGGRKAYRAGIRHWQATWGDALAKQLTDDMSAGRVRNAMKAIAVLLRYHKKGLLDVLRALRRTRIGESSELNRIG